MRRLPWCLALALCFLTAAARASEPDPAAKPVSSLSMGRCALIGGQESCFEAIRCGLAPDDRSKIKLLSDGTVLVDQKHRSESPNYRALRLVASADIGTRLDVLAPTDDYIVRRFLHWPEDGEPALGMAVMGHPATGDGFLGYTFFPYLGRSEEGIIYSPDSETDVVVNARQTRPAISVTIYHELRHVVFGDFGRTPTLAKHNELPELETAIKAAESETERNATRRCPT